MDDKCWPDPYGYRYLQAPSPQRAEKVAGISGHLLRAAALLPAASSRRRPNLPVFCWRPLVRTHPPVVERARTSQSAETTSSLPPSSQAAEMFDAVVGLLGRVALYGCCFFLGLYVVPQVLLANFCRSQDLKKKYGATWALVTGGSSGAWSPCYPCWICYPCGFCLQPLSVLPLVPAVVTGILRLPQASANPSPGNLHHRVSTWLLWPSMTSCSQMPSMSSKAPSPSASLHG